MLVGAVAAATMLAGLASLGVAGTARAAGNCPTGTVLVSINPADIDPENPDTDLYWNDLFAQTFASRDKNGNLLVCATFTPGWNNLRVTDDK
jgi:hypothetical protein